MGIHLKLSKNLIYPFLMGISNICLVYSQSFLEKTYEIDGKQVKFSKHQFVVIWMMFIAECSIITFYFIQRKLSSTSSIRETIVSENLLTSIETVQGIKLELIPGQKKIKSILLIIMCLFLDLSASTSLNIIRQTSDIKYLELMLRLFALLASTALCIWLLKYKYYIHHFVGIAFIFIGLIGYTIINTVFILETQFSWEIVGYFMLFLLFYLVSSIQEVTEKYLMHYKYLSPYVVIGLQGFGGIIVFIPFFIILNQIPCPENSLLCDNKSSSNHSVENVLETLSLVFSHYQFLIPFFCYILFSMMFNTFRLLTNQKYSPTHRIISDVFQTFLSWLIGIIVSSASGESLNWGYYFVAGIGYLVVILGVLIYLEIVIIDWCGLATNTRTQIENRQTEEIKLDCSSSIKGAFPHVKKENELYQKKI